MSVTPDLQVLRDQISALSKTKKRALTKIAAKVLARPWLPQPGPQHDAYYHPADELLYGGAAGGGKTDLVVGLATTAHMRSLIFRRQATDLDGVWERLEEVVDAKGLVETQNQVKKRMEMRDGRLIEMGHLEQPGSEKSWQGRPHDLIAFDEAAQLDEMKVNFVCQWLRSVDPEQRCRVVMATNPPVPDLKNGRMTDVSTGDWLKRWFAPWIDADFENPAEVGELRWCLMRLEGDRMVTIWVDGPGWYRIEDGSRSAIQEPSDVEAQRLGLAKARSRTFIRSLVRDNYYLRGTGYLERLSSTPEPLRSMLMSGQFGIKLEDHDMQIIPTNWVLAAQERWRAEIDRISREPGASLAPMRVLAADIAQGGADSTILAPLRENLMFDRLHVSAGRDTPDGPSVVQRLIQVQANGATIVLDGGGGWGGSTRDLLKLQHRIDAIMCIASAASTDWSKDMRWKFLNLRAQMWWKFREALDPESGQNVMLPPSDVLLAQLTATHFGLRGITLLAESKDAVRLRIGTSTDEADAVIMAWHYLPYAVALEHRVDPLSVAQGGWNPNVDRSDPRKRAADLDDPLSEWNDI
jgi:hypothetical protein